MGGVSKYVDDIDQRAFGLIERINNPALHDATLMSYFVGRFLVPVAASGVVAFSIYSYLDYAGILP